MMLLRKTEFLFVFSVFLYFLCLHFVVGSLCCQLEVKSIPDAFIFDKEIMAHRHRSMTKPKSVLRVGGLLQPEAAGVYLKSIILAMTKW